MKLLYIGCNVGTESMPKYFREVSDYSELKLDSSLAINLEKIVETPDIIFIQIQSDTIDGKNTCSFIGESIGNLKNRGAFVINWTGDKRSSVPSWMFHFAKHVNVTGFSNQEDSDNFKSKGFNSVFLQQGIDTNIFKPEGEIAKTADIVFLANHYGNQFPLSKYRKNIVQTLQNKYGERFKVYGNGWRNAGNVNSSQYEEAKVYRGAKIAVSCSHFDSDRYFSDRLGRSLCSGAFVLSHNYKGIEKDFKIGTHLDVFNDINHLINQIDFYLEQEDLRNEISKEGQKHASKEFSYQNIIKEICLLKH
jgi:spore maturation protein CgeB